LAENRSQALHREREWHETGPRNPILPDKHVPHMLAHSHVRALFAQQITETICGKPNPSILDIGMGNGELVCYFGRDIKYCGIDISTVALQTAHKSFSHVDCVGGDAIGIPFASDTFDTVFCSGLLHHIVGQGDLVNTVVKEMARVAKSGGAVLALEPNVLYPTGLVMNVVARLNPEIYARIGFVPHERCLSPGFIRDSFIAAELRNVDLRACSYATNRFPESLQRGITSFEERCSKNFLCSRFGWWSCLKGEKP